MHDNENVRDDNDGDAEVVQPIGSEDDQQYMINLPDDIATQIMQARRDEKKRLDHLKQDQTMLVIKRFSKRKKVFRERKKTGKIRAKRFPSNNDKTSNESLLDLKKVEGYMFYGSEEDEKELLEMVEVGEGPFGEGEGGTIVAGVDRDRDAEKEET
ncbi:hypothetical protein Tco_0583055 [Tanacetum coccineum]